MKLIKDPDLLDQYRSDESGVSGTVAAAVRPKSASDVVDLVKECAAGGTGLLPVGCQTATTGAAVPQDDVVVDLTRLAGVVDIDRDNMIAEVLPGTITYDLKQAVQAEGLYYPPDPTSEKESTIGGNAAANASGARTFRWGMTADWVEGLEVVTGKGELHRLFRHRVDKNTAGYLPFHDPLRLFLGSEGTLGFVTRVWVKLIADPGPFYAFILYFPSLRDALETAVDLRLARLSPSPRCVELFDEQALELLGSHPKAPQLPSAAQAALYMEYDTCGRDLDRVIEEDLAGIGHNVLLDDTLVGQTLAEKAYIRELRHHIPETGNQMAKAFHARGGLKVSTEFCVPPQRFLEMMDYVDKTSGEAGVDFLLRYGHVGNGHPHVYTRGRDRKEVGKLKKLAHLWCERAVALGGTVSGEHGIGKTRRDYLKYMYPPAFIAAMRSVKREVDPSNIFAVGNIFPDTKGLVPEFF